MLINFQTNIKKEQGVLVFLCLKSMPLDDYLLNINKKYNTSYDKYRI